MSRKSLDKIGPELGVTLPEKFVRFLIDQKEVLEAPRKTLSGEVVIETSPGAILKLNRTLRKNGIVTGDECAERPWPHDYLALSDNGAGNYQCIRLTEKTGSLYRFDGETGLFSRKFPSPDAYLAHLRQRLAKFRKSSKGKSDPKLLKSAPALHADGTGLNLPIRYLQGPVTAEKWRDSGLDWARLRRNYALMLEAVTRISRGSWSVTVQKTEHALIRLTHKQPSRKSPQAFTYEGLQYYNGDLSLKVRVEDLQTTLDSSKIDWIAFSEALSGFFSASLNVPVRAELGKVRPSRPTAYRYAQFACSYALLSG